MNTGIIGYIIILVYAISKMNGELSEKYESLNDHDKLCDLIEDQIDLKKYANYCVHRAQKNIEKLQKLFPNKKS